MKSKVLRLLLWVCLTPSLSSCVHFYSTVKIPINQISLSQYLAKKPIWTLEDSNHKVNIIGDALIRNDSIFGKLYSQRSLDHPADKKTYPKGQGRYSRSYVHLYVNSSQSSDLVQIPISAITDATTHEKAVGTNTLTNVGMLTGSILILSAVCNCPYVKVIGADTAIFNGSLFPGAISKSLERTDHLILNSVPLTQEGNINVRISNELPEIEYFNRLELFEVRDQQHSNLAQDALGQVISYNLQNRLISAATPSNVDIVDKVQSVKDDFYDFSEQGNDYELNKMFLKFDRTNLNDKAMLIIRAKQSKWMEKVAAFTLQQFGTALDSWTKRLDKVDPQKFNQNSIDRGISMNAYIRRNDKWDYIGSFANAGTLAYRELALNIDLSQSTKQITEIKLEAAHGFWDVDYAGLTDEWSEKITLTKLETISIVNQEGKDVWQATEANDLLYTELPTQGDFLNIHFEAPSSANSNFILKGKGYYHHEREYTAKPNYKFLKAVHRDKITTHQLSRLLSDQANTFATIVKK